jgi:hypothetical protein
VMGSCSAGTSTSCRGPPEEGSRVVPEHPARNTTLTPVTASARRRCPLIPWPSPPAGASNSRGRSSHAHPCLLGRCSPGGSISGGRTVTARPPAARQGSWHRAHVDPSIGSTAHPRGGPPLGCAAPSGAHSRFLAWSPGSGWAQAWPPLAGTPRSHRCRRHRQNDRLPPPEPTASVDGAGEPSTWPPRNRRISVDLNR